jgi:FSR family fosmidomycin resistance protein-like MFS transporter
VGVAMMAVGHGVNDTYAYALQAMLPALIGTLGFSVGMGGVLVSLYQGVSSCLQPVFGHLSDRHNLRWFVWGGVAMSGIAGGLMGVAGDYWTLVALVIVGGIGTAAFHPVSGAMVTVNSPPNERGRWYGLYHTGGNVGTAMGPLLFGLIIAYSELGMVWVTMMLAIACAAALIVTCPHRSRLETHALPFAETMRRHGRVVMGYLLVVVLRSCFGSALLTFIPLLGHAHGLSQGDAAQGLTVYLAAGTLGGIVAGWAGDRWPRERVAITMLLASMPLGWLIALWPDAGVGFFLVTAACGFCLSGSMVVIMIRAQESVTESVGLVTGVVGGLSFGIAGLAVAPLAFLADAVGLTWATVVASTFALGAVAAIRALPPPAIRVR